MSEEIFGETFMRKILPSKLSKRSLIQLNRAMKQIVADYWKLTASWETYMAPNRESLPRKDESMIIAFRHGMTSDEQIATLGKIIWNIPYWDIADEHPTKIKLNIEIFKEPLLNPTQGEK